MQHGNRFGIQKGVRCVLLYGASRVAGRGGAARVAFPASRPLQSCSYEWWAWRGFPPHWHSPSGGGHEALLLLPLRHGAGMCRVAPAAAITAKWIANIVFAAVRTRTPTREEARAAAARACLRAGPLPEPCVCSSGTASGGRVERRRRTWRHDMLGRRELVRQQGPFFLSVWLAARILAAK